VGLAGGWDKNGVAVRGLACLGFGHLEVGTVTMLPQEGLPRPRIHRIPEHAALINRMGFPNNGVEALAIPQDARKLTRIGINIGKGKDTPLEQAHEDYCGLLERVYDQADYVSLNISSPNTVGLRDLQARAAIEGLLRAVTDLRDSLTPRVPLLVKVAPDMTEAELDAVLEAVDATGVDGLIATNATVDRTGMPDFAVGLAGGLSGPPVRAMSTAVVRYVARQTGGRLPIIGVGGVGHPDDALEKLDAGATLVQVNTGLVYAGPNLVKRINLRMLREGARR
jgi:dihydroorotate dehydrogenase